MNFSEKIQEDIINLFSDDKEKISIIIESQKNKLYFDMLDEIQRADYIQDTVVKK